MLRKYVKIFSVILGISTIPSKAIAEEAEPIHIQAKQPESFSIEVGGGSLYVVPLVQTSIQYIPPILDRNLSVYVQYKMPFGLPSDFGNTHQVLLGSRYFVFKHETNNYGGTKVFLSFSPVSLQYNYGAFNYSSGTKGGWEGGLKLSPVFGIGITMVSNENIGITADVQGGIISSTLFINPNVSIHFGF